MKDWGDLSAYETEINELLDWLSDGPKTERQFDSEFSTMSLMRKPGKCIAYKPNTPWLGSLSQGMGPYCWAGRLDLLKYLIARKFVTAKKKNGIIEYALIGGV